ncbi:ABC transporter permease [Paludibacter jiangxiensis]|uniref:ABC-2 type transport system permease protein n=1 Tax=Paludibacter jiangxiensis TaxID=681398 RepID=A0A161LVX2_9BACT|nr:ABC transporter permease [Paludibacter jiangxiensis]GAT63499.1 ABC-2 type transport system permease protein [Paludibacter jiangxiensis]
MLRFLIEKEFKQLLRNPFLPRMIVMFPVMVLLVFPWAANFEISNINLSIVDHDHSSFSQRLTQKIVSSGYFRLTDVSPGYDQALKSVEKNNADVVLEIPPRFEKELERDQHAKLLVAANTVNGTKGGLSTGYLANIINGFASDLRKESGQISRASITPTIDIVPYYRFNPNLNYKVFMVPALMVMVLTMLCGFMPALNIVNEKEAGTMEQINVTPVPKFTFIVAKLLPFWIIGSLVITVSFGVAWLVYGLVPAGHFSTIYLFAAIYVLGISGFGLVISNYSDTIQQAMFVMYFFIMVLIMLSGLFTPVSSMPQWAQTITVFNSLKYFMQVMRLVYLKGSGIADMLPQLGALVGFALAFNTWAVLSYKKKN